MRVSLCTTDVIYTTQHRTVPIIFRLICIKINILIFVEVTDKTKLSPFMAHGVYCLFWVPRNIIMINLVFVAKKCTTFHKSLSYIDYILPTFVKQDKCGVSNYTFHHTTPSRIDSQNYVHSLNTCASFIPLNSNGPHRESAVKGFYVNGTIAIILTA